MASFAEFARFCAARSGCDKGGLYAIQPRGLRGSPIKIGYSFNLLRRLSTWEYSYPSGIGILAVARMNRPNDTHFHKRRALQLAEALLKHELHQYVVAREEWLQPWAKAETLAAMRRLQLSLSPNLAGHFFDAAQIKAGPRERRAGEVHADLHVKPAAPRPQPTRRQRREPPVPVLWPCHLRHKGRGAEVRGGRPVPLGAVAAAPWARQVRGDWSACSGRIADPCLAPSHKACTEGKPCLRGLLLRGSLPKRQGGWRRC